LETCPQPTAERLAAARQRLDRARLESFGQGEAPSDAELAAALTGGLFGNPAFQDIVDDLLVRQHCLCCYSAPRRAQAERADARLALLVSYFVQEDYESSNAFYRALAALGRDLTPAEAAQVQAHPREGPYDTRPPPRGAEGAALRAAGAFARTPGLGGLHAYHPHLAGEEAGAGAGVLAAAGLGLWLCSTAEARRYLRRLAREARKRGVVLATRLVAGEWGGFVPRFRLRYYSVDFHGEGGVAGAWKALRGAQGPPTPEPRVVARGRAGRHRAVEAPAGKETPAPT
jgi:hypothetical protein